MYEPGNFSDRPSVYARAEPDDEYDRRPDPLDPYLVDRDEYDIEDEEELDDDEEDED